MATELHRRDMLLGLTALPITAASANGVTTAISPPKVSSASKAWDAAMAQFLEARHEEALEDARFDRVRAAWKRTAPDETAVDWAKLTFADRYDLMTLDIDAYRATLMAPHWESPLVADRIAQRFAALEQLRTYREAVRANDERHDYSRAVERCELAVERACEAEQTLMNMPAPHCQALLWKLQAILIVDEDGFSASWSGSYVEQTIADMSRLLGTPAEAQL